MLRFIAMRIVNATVAVWGLVTIVFLITKLIPGDEARAAAGRNASVAQVEQVREQLGLDKPVVVQYFDMIGRVLHGNLGQSTVTRQPVLSDILNLLPSTIELVVVAMVLTVVVGGATAIISSWKRGGAVDSSFLLLSVVAGGVPVFWLAYLLQWWFSATLNLLPAAGQLSSRYSVPRITGMTTVDALLSGNMVAAGDAFAHLILPAVVLSLGAYSGLFRILRTSMSATLSEEYIDSARAKGATSGRILFRHALRNASIPSMSMIGMQVGWAIAGSMLIEAVFSRQGIGSYLTNSVLEKDTQATFGTVLVLGVIVVAISLVVDLLQIVVDPRVRHRQTEGAAA